MYTPCKPQFYCIKVGFKGSSLYRGVFVMAAFLLVMGVPKSKYERVDFSNSGVKGL